MSAWPSCCMIRLQTVDCKKYEKMQMNIVFCINLLRRNLIRSHVFLLISFISENVEHAQVNINFFLYFHRKNEKTRKMNLCVVEVLLLTLPDAVPPATPIRNGVFVSLGDMPFTLMPFILITSGSLDILTSFVSI